MCKHRGDLGMPAEIRLDYPLHRAAGEVAASARRREYRVYRKVYGGSFRTQNPPLRFILMVIYVF
jgi:hypothetical protein